MPIAEIVVWPQASWTSMEREIGININQCRTKMLEGGYLHLLQDRWQRYSHRGGLR